jgi:hypothetical protein
MIGSLSRPEDARPDSPRVLLKLLIALRITAFSLANDRNVNQQNTHYLDKKLSVYN